SPASRGRRLDGDTFGAARETSSATFADVIEEEWEEEVDDLVGDEDSAKHGGSHRWDAVPAYSACPEHRSEAQDQGRLGQQFRPQAMDRPVEHGAPEAFIVDGF